MTIFGGMFPWSFFIFPAGYLVFRNIKNLHADKDKLIFLSGWIIFIWFLMQIAQSKLASYIFPVFPAIAILIGYYFARLLQDKKEIILRRSMEALSYLMMILVFVGAIANVFYGKKYAEIITDMGSIYLFSFFLIICALMIFFFCRKRLYAHMIGSMASITGIFLFSVFFGYAAAEPWISCKEITDIFKKIDSSNGTVLCSKFYVRGVRYYTDREVAVIDSGDGFFTPHPIPFLNNDAKVLEFLNKQAFTFCIVKDSNVKDLERIAKTGNYEVSYFEEIGGKHILKLEKFKS